MMMRAGWNPIRRNRNIGTKAHGHGENNRLSIPESWHELKYFYDKLNSFVPIQQQIRTHKLTFLIEATRPNWFHTITVDDACVILTHLPPEDLKAFDLIVMRQPTRKQRILSPVWGRAIFCFDIKEFNGRAIILEAQTEESFTWPISLSPASVRELDRLAEDGHQIQKKRRCYEIHPTFTSLRNTMLYRTLLHEVGHHVDYQNYTEEEWDIRTSQEKEDYAHRYAAEKAAQLRAAGICPFYPIINTMEMANAGLKIDWFAGSKIPYRDRENI